MVFGSDRKQPQNELCTIYYLRNNRNVNNLVWSYKQTDVKRKWSFALLIIGWSKFLDYI
jgi:hypothetical protein